MRDIHGFFDVGLQGENTAVVPQKDSDEQANETKEESSAAMPCLVGMILSFLVQ